MNENGIFGGETLWRLVILRLLQQQPQFIR